MMLPKLKLHLAPEHVRQWPIWAIVGLLIFILVAIIWFASGVPGRSGSLQQFTITSGESRKTIAANLESSGIIRSKIHFVIVSYWERRPLMPGIYMLNPHDNVFVVARHIESGDVTQQVVTIPEGWRREQIADYLATKGVNKNQFLTLSAGKEGQLFPDTYYINLKPTAEEVINDMLTDYQKRVAAIKPTTDQLILASIVEREAKDDTQRALIAGIYTNRLKLGMKLEADPTVQYGRDTNVISSGQALSRFWQPITANDYTSVVSPFNTYLNNGLPPTPICDPGLKSIEAAIHPAATDALYFFNTPDGAIITSKTLDEHKQKVQQYLK